MKHSTDMTSIAESDGRHMNCNLDLRLSQPPPPPRDLQQLTVFYNGRICVRDVTEIQARAIILEASKEGISPIASGSNSPAVSMVEQCNAAAACSSELSMKKSLQSFLQMRKYRRRAAAPYNR